MVAKSLLVLCASACFFKVIAAQCIGANNNFGNTALAAEELAYAGNALAYGAGLGAPLAGYPANSALGYGFPANSITPTLLSSPNVIAAQCIGANNNFGNTALAAEELAYAGNALAYGAGLGAPLAGYPANSALGYGFPANSITPTNGGGFTVTSSSPIAPTGITVISENAIEGAIAVNGQLPFLGAIALEGALPSAGAGAINYGCGNGAVGIVSEGISPAVAPAYPAGLGYANGLAGGLGYGAGLPGLGVNGRAGLGLGGCGAIY